MSISRAFTNRRVKQSIRAAEISENSPQRNNSIRNKISSPVQLLHTTNMLSYNAPDIHPMSASSTSSSPRSDDDMSDSALTAGTTPPTSPDVESSPKRSLSPAPNHLSSHFILADRQKQKPAPAPTRTEAPVIPQRALSQPRKPNTLVRQRSASQMSQQSRGSSSTKASFSFSRSSSTSTSTSVSSTPGGYTHHKPKLPSTAAAPATPLSPVAPPSPPRSQSQSRSQPPPRSQSQSRAQPPPRAPQQQQQQPPPRPQQQQQPPQQQQHKKDYSDTHPFGPELAQVSEIAEEYGVKEHLASALEIEEREMRQLGLCKFSADDYLLEVRALFPRFMGAGMGSVREVVSPVREKAEVPQPRAVAAGWI